jgi:hypothetical protein
VHFFWPKTIKFTVLGHLRDLLEMLLYVGLAHYKLASGTNIYTCHNLYGSFDFFE